VNELLVDAVEQEMALRGLGDGADEQHPDAREHHHAGHQAGAQRGDHVRGARSA
jgi:hypothetical protein